MMLPAPSQVTGVDEIIRHADPNVNCSSPDVVVLSVYVPSELTVHVPVTWRDPVTGADGQPAPALINVMSSSPATFRHDDVTFQVPTTSPPQGLTLEQDVPPPLPPPAPPEPDVAPDPPMLEVAPEPLGEVLLDDEQASIKTAGTRIVCA